MKEFLQSIADDTKDIFAHDIETTKAYAVPGRNDVGLTFGRNQVKKGKLIETCVLFIDIRNSTGISRRLSKDKAKLGKIYSAFVDAMASIADRYGYVRNIIGDRVMVVFEPTNCFVNAVHCAAMMHTVSVNILKHYSGLEDFKVGIGIEYGEMLVLKTGIQKKHEEQSEYKNLVWVGDAANQASKLTDFSNKEYNSPIYKVTYEYWQRKKKFTGLSRPDTLPLNFLSPGMIPAHQPQFESQFEQKTMFVHLSADEFHKKIKMTDEWKYDDQRVISIEKKDQNGTSSAILLSGKVYDEFAKAEPKSPLLQRLSKRVYPNAPIVQGGIYGGSLHLPEIKQIKL